MAKRSPTVRERRLARALRHLREEAGLTIEEVAEKLEMSASTVSRMETAQVGVRPRDLRFLLDMYEVSEAERDQLLQIARERRQQQLVAGVRRPAQHPFRRARGRRLDHLAVLDPAHPRPAPDRGLRPRRPPGDPARRQAWRHRAPPRAADPPAGAAHARARPRVLGRPRRGRGAPAGRRAGGHGRAARAADRGGQAAERDPPGAAVHQRRARRDGRRVHRLPLPRVRGPRRRLHREHRERPLPGSSRGDPQVQQDLRPPAGRGAEPGRVHPDPRRHPVPAD